jgi:uncharacterized protein YeaC (DUF1315 family)
VFNVSKDFIVKAIEEVGKANELKHPDGSSYTGKEKYDVVFDALVVYAGQYNWKPESSTINAVIEMVVSYLKSKKKEG